MPSPYDSRAIANEVLIVATQKGLQLTVMQIIKLVYLVNGWGTAILHRQIVEDDVQAWQYGPVYPRVYKSFNRFGSSPIREYAAQSGVMFRADLNPEEQQLIESVVDAYGSMHAFQLSDLMHQPGTPWTETFNLHGAYSEIPQELIATHFERIRDERSGRR